MVAEHGVAACEVIIEDIFAISILPEKIEMAAHQVGVQGSKVQKKKKKKKKKKKYHFIIASLKAINNH